MVVEIEEEMEDEMEEGQGEKGAQKVREGDKIVGMDGMANGIQNGSGEKTSTTTHLDPASTTPPPPNSQPHAPSSSSSSIPKPSSSATDSSQDHDQAIVAATAEGEIRTLDGDIAGDEFAAEAQNYQILLARIDGLLERLKLDA